MSKHAILSCSGASRWMACPPSARLEEQFPNKTSPYAEEGTLAHSLGEEFIKYKLGRISLFQLKARLNGIGNNEHYNDSMYEYCDEYATFVVEQFSEAQAQTKDALIFLEQKLNLTDYVPEGFGTGDVVIVSEPELHLIDLKYGKGVPVYADNNTQMMLYALGALREFDMAYDIDNVRMTLYQPRINNISTWEVSVDELKLWAEAQLKPKAHLAFAGAGEYVPGSHCMFCKAKAVCKALATQNLEMAKYDFQDENLLTDDEIADILNRADLFTTWITAVEEHALAKALEGKKWPGYKLVEGRSNRKYSDAEAVAERLKEQGFADEAIYKKSLIGITELEKNINKKLVEKYLKGLIVKPQGKPALVPVTDKRPEYSSVDSAARDFANID